MRSANESLKTRASARGRPSLFQRRRQLFQRRPGILPALARIGTEADAHQVREPSRHGANLFERLAFRCRRPPRQHFVEDHSHSVHVVARPGDRKSTRLNSSHTVISYAVFCLKKKKKKKNSITVY